MSDPHSSEAGLEQALQAATAEHLSGHLAQAEAAYRNVLDQSPNHPVAWHRFGVLALQRGDVVAALERLGRAVELDPSAWRSHCSLGQAWTALDRAAEAAAAFRRALELNPACLEAALGLGAACRALGLGQEAVQAFSRAADLQPDHAEARNNLGTCLQDLGRLDAAIAQFRQALALQDDYPIAHSNLGNALLEAGQAAAAVDQLNAVVARWPDFADAWYNLGNAQFTAGRLEPAVAAFRKALALLPGHLRAWNNLGNALQALGRNPEALDCYQQAMRLRPDFVEAYNNAAAAARAMGRVDDALALLRAALERNPGAAVSHGNLGHIYKDAGMIEQAVRCFRRALELDPGDRVTHSNLAYAVTFLPGLDARAILDENLAWDRAHAAAIRPDRSWPNRPDPERRLRIGYVSPDFREHCQSLFTWPLLSRHDHGQFDIHCYARVPRPDALTERLRACADTWRDTVGQDDAQVAELVRADRIDILVDLTMHMANGRPLLFARKPAPVQVAWLAYPGTTGLAAMDYRLTDPYLDPPGQQDACYKETSIRLADTFWCYDPLTSAPQPGPLPALAEGRITFGCLNNPCKVTAAVLDLWARVLGAVPGSRLLLLSPEGAHRRGVLERLAAAGTAPDRVEFAPFLPRLDYLALHRRVDLGLDTFPYNGHTTSLDAFWMGVPVVTRIGATVVGRAGWSQLCNLDLRELAADSDEKFVYIASELAKDLPRLARLRGELRPRMEASPLMDGERFTRSLEGVYRDLWRRWCTERPA
jgi:predicted O-linked N-acetylglucosamine transferase (SPINDLY family)